MEKYKKIVNGLARYKKFNEIYNESYRRDLSPKYLAYFKEIEDYYKQVTEKVFNKKFKPFKVELDDEGYYDDKDPHDINRYSNSAMQIENRVYYLGSEDKNDDLRIIVDGWTIARLDNKGNEEINFETKWLDYLEKFSEYFINLNMSEFNDIIKVCKAKYIESRDITDTVRKHLKKTESMMPCIML